jgi:hypothetical protein
MIPRFAQPFCPIKTHVAPDFGSTVNLETL